MPYNPRSLGQFAAAADLASRQAWEWQQEAAGALAGLLKPQRAPAGLEAFCEAARAEAAAAVRQASARLLRDAVRESQRLGSQLGELDDGKGRLYGPVPEQAVLKHIDPRLQWLLALGPKRSLRRALYDAAELLPDELWKSPGGWRSLGERRQRAPGWEPPGRAQARLRG